MVRILKLEDIAHTYACHRFILNIYIYNNHDSPRCNFSNIKKREKKIRDNISSTIFFFSSQSRTESSKLNPASLPAR